MMKTASLRLLTRLAASSTRVPGPPQTAAWNAANTIMHMRMMSTKPPPPYDGHLDPEQMETLNHMYDKIDDLEKQIKELKQAVKETKLTYAVDAPDGDSDGHIKEEMLEIEHIIDEAAAHEDKESIEKKHKIEEDVKKFHARDPEHDW